LASFKKSTIVRRTTQLVLMTLGGLALADIALGQSDGIRRQAGTWQKTQTLLAIETPQAAPSLRAAARASIGRAIVSDRICLTSQDVSRDTLATRLSAFAPTDTDFRWTQLEFGGMRVTASGISARGRVAVEGRLTPVLTEIVATTNMIDPVIGEARRVHRTIMMRLGPC
jgi:hypothetical protein